MIEAMDNQKATDVLLGLDSTWESVDVLEHSTKGPSGISAEFVSSIRPVVCGPVRQRLRRGSTSLWESSGKWLLCGRRREPADSSRSDRLRDPEMIENTLLSRTSSKHSHKKNFQLVTISDINLSALAPLIV